jgi:hypothetical protein
MGTNKPPPPMPPPAARADAKKTANIVRPSITSKGFKSLCVQVNSPASSAAQEVLSGHAEEVRGSQPSPTESEAARRGVERERKMRAKSVVAGAGLGILAIATAKVWARHDPSRLRERAERPTDHANLHLPDQRP